jgi:hypothetical protein
VRRRSPGRYVPPHRTALISPSTQGPARGHSTRPRRARSDAACRPDRGDDLGISRLGHRRDQPLPACGGRLRGHDRARERDRPRCADRHRQASRLMDPPPGGAFPSPRRLLDSSRRGHLGRRSFSHSGPRDQRGSQCLAPGGRADRSDARRGRHAARRRVGRRASFRPASLGRGARCARRLRRARDRGLRGRSDRRRGRARPGSAAPAARRLGLPGRSRHCRLGARERRARNSGGTRVREGRRLPCARRGPPAGSRTIPGSTLA